MVDCYAEEALSGSGKVQEVEWESIKWPSPLAGFLLVRQSTWEVSKPFEWGDCIAILEVTSLGLLNFSDVLRPPIDLLMRHWYANGIAEPYFPCISKKHICNVSRRVGELEISNEGTKNASNQQDHNNINETSMFQISGVNTSSALS